MFLRVFGCFLFLISLGNGFNYCQKNTDHVLCSTNTFKANRGSRSCLKNMKTLHFSGEVEAAILEVLNYYREKAATGKIPNGKGFELGFPSANMMKLKWDEELSYMATKLSRLCKPYSLCEGCLDLERFPSTYVQSFTFVNNKKRISFDWQSYIEAIIVNSDDSNSGYNNTNSLDVLIWAEIYLVGCGLSISTIEDRTVHNFVCTFGPVVPEENEEPSVEGNPCSYCPLGSKCLSDLDVLCDCVTDCYPIKYEDLKRMRRQGASANATADAGSGDQAGNTSKADGAAEEGSGETTTTTKSAEGGSEQDKEGDGAPTGAQGAGGLGPVAGDDVAVDPAAGGGGGDAVMPDLATVSETPPALDTTEDTSGSSHAMAMIFIIQLFYAFSVTKILK